MNPVHFAGLDERATRYRAAIRKTAQWLTGYYDKVGRLVFVARVRTVDGWTPGRGAGMNPQARNGSAIHR